MKIGSMEMKILDFIFEGEKSRRQLINFQMRIYQNNFWAKLGRDTPFPKRNDNFPRAGLTAGNCIKRIERMVDKGLLTENEEGYFSISEYYKENFKEIDVYNDKE